MKSKPKGLTREKACEIARHGEVRGKRLSGRQKGFFGARCGGTSMSKRVRTPKKVKR